MKGTLERDTLNHLAGLFVDVSGPTHEFRTLVQAAAATFTEHRLSVAAKVYVNEEDADVIKADDCLLLYPRGWRPINATVGGYVYEFYVAVCAFSRIMPADGVNAAHERAATLLGCAIDLLLSNHSYEPAHWTAARPDEPADLADEIAEALGALGRSSCHQMALQIPVDY